MLFSSPSIGIDFSGDPSIPSAGQVVVRVALVKGEKIVGRGEGKDLASALAGLGEHPKKAVICLPAEKVYTVLLRLPRETDKVKKEELFQKELSKAIPEEIEECTYVSTVLQKEKDTEDIGVIAVRKDVLKHALDECKKADLQVSAAVTLPIAVASLIELPKEVQTFLLVLPRTITVFKEGWPIDEAVVDADTPEEKRKEELHAMQEEYSSSHVWAQGVDGIDGALPALPWFTEDPVWIGAAAASLFSKGKQSAMFDTSGNQEKKEAKRLKASQTKKVVALKKEDSEKKGPHVHWLIPVCILTIIGCGLLVYFMRFRNTESEPPEVPPIERSVPQVEEVQQQEEEPPAETEETQEEATTETESESAEEEEELLIEEGQEESTE